MLGILVVWLAARMILANTFSIGLLIAFIAYKDLFLQRVSDLIDTFVELRMLGLHAERLADIALTAPEPRGRAARRAGAARRWRSRCATSRSATAPNDPWVLEDVSFRIEAGRVGGDRRPLGLRQDHAPEAARRAAAADRAARSSSTASRSPGSGAETWRAMIGVVMQDDSLFAGSIADNIGFFAADPDRDAHRGLRPARPRCTTTSPPCRWATAR